MVSAVSQWFTMKKLVLMNWGIPDIPHFNSNFFHGELAGDEQESWQLKDDTMQVRRSKRDKGTC